MAVIRQLLSAKQVMESFPQVSYNHGVLWVGRVLKYQLVSTTCYGQGNSWSGGGTNCRDLSACPGLVPYLGFDSHRPGISHGPFGTGPAGLGQVAQQLGSLEEEFYVNH